MKPSILQTTGQESSKSWRFRQLMNWYTMYFGTGGKILFWNAAGVVHAQIERLCYIASKQHYEERKNDRQQSRFHR